MFWFIFIASIYLTILVLVSIFRQKPARQYRRVALVIGNRAYPDDEITKAFEDAKAVAYELDRLGFKVSEEHDLGVEKMRCVLRDFKHKASGAAWALVYFSGHGMELKGENWLVPIDAELKRSADLQHQAVSLERVLECISGASKLRKRTAFSRWRL